MKVLSALKITCVGFGGGVLLRVVQMLFFYDYETGFATDGGLTAWLCLGFAVVASVLACLFCFQSRRYFGPYVSRKNVGLGVVALLSGTILLFTGIMRFLDYLSYRKAGAFSQGAGGQRGVLNLLFLAACFLFGLVQVYGSLGFFTGKNGLAKAPLLYLTAVVWGISYLVLVFVFYARFSSFVENFFAIMSGASLLLALFYLCKLLAGLDEEGAAKRLFVTGICAVILTVTYTAANLALLLLGKTYSGEIPLDIQLALLGVAAFLLVFLVTFRKYSIRRTPKTAGVQKTDPPAEEKPASGGKRFRAS